MNKYFKNRVLELMHEKNIKQIALADAIGLTQATLSRNINGIHEPKADVVQKIAQFFNVSTDYLLGNTDNRNEILDDSTTEIDLSQLDSIDIALFDATKELTDSEKTQILDFVNYIKNKKPSGDGK